MIQFIFVAQQNGGRREQFEKIKKTNRIDTTNKEDGEDDWIGPNPHEAVKKKKSKQISRTDFVPDFAVSQCL